MSNEADTIVSAIIAKWCAGFVSLDAAALSSLYSKSAFFFGSNPALYRGRDGVADYGIGAQGGVSHCRRDDCGNGGSGRK